MTHLVSPETIDTTAALAALEAGLAEADGQILALSDFDHVLCHEYGFDLETNNRIPRLDPQVVEAAQEVPLLIGTGRLAHNPAIPLLWESGLVSVDMPVISENGGTIIERRPDGTLQYSDLVTPQEIQVLDGVQQTAEANLPDLPDGQQLIFKVGRTMLIARLQDEAGNIEADHQAWLAEELSKVLPSDELQAVNSRASVAIQHKRINKGVGFLHCLKSRGLAREDLFVVGMGDAPNDEKLLKQADLRIGFNSAIREIVDIEVPAGEPQVTTDVLNIIGNAVKNS